MIKKLLVILLLTGILSCSEKELKVSDFCKSLEPVHRILEDPDWTNWDMAPIYGPDEKVHLFVGRWPKGESWLKKAQIVHMIAEKPEGPYRFVDTVFQCDTSSYYNPHISKEGELFVMVFSYKERSKPNINQQIGIATTKSLYGPWKMSPNNPIIAPSFVPESPNAIHASNPSFIKDKNGKYRIYYKSISDVPAQQLRTISVAMSDHIEGPYTNYQDNPLISYVAYDLDVEDPYTFLYKEKYHMILEDRMGVANIHEGRSVDPDTVRKGGWRPGLIFTSDDGFDWGEPEIGYQANSYYFEEETKRFERPHILWKDGTPEYLFMAIMNGKYGLGSGAVLKINNRD